MILGMHSLGVISFYLVQRKKSRKKGDSVVILQMFLWKTGKRFHIWFLFETENPAFFYYKWKRCQLEKSEISEVSIFIRLFQSDLSWFLFDNDVYLLGKYDYNHCHKTYFLSSVARKILKKSIFYFCKLFLSKQTCACFCLYNEKINEINRKLSPILTVPSKHNTKIRMKTK